MENLQTVQTSDEVYHHSLPIQIRFNDVDRYGHVNNNAYFAYYDLGKEEYLRNVLKVDYRRADVVPSPTSMPTLYCPFFMATTS